MIDQYKKHFVLIEIPPSTKPIRLLVKETGELSELTVEEKDNLRFRIEENTHPINVLSDTVDCQPEIDFKVLERFDTKEEGTERMHKLLEEEL